jgi:hypothetical protein
MKNRNMKTPIPHLRGFSIWLGVTRSMVWTVLVASAISFGTNAFAQTSKAELIGHWRQTTFLIDGSPKDTHMVLRGDGTAEVWEVTAESRGEKSTGRWDVDGKTLSIDGASLPFTFYEGKLVYPNIQNSRGFWDRIE